MDRLGRYEILEELGHGAMGTVYRGRDPRIDRIVAIKTIRLPGLEETEEGTFRERFLREAQAAGKLSHAGIVTIHDVGEEESTRTPFIVMEYIAGNSVESLLREAEGGRMPPGKALELAQQVAEALDYAHSQGIVHRDIKPANILVTHQGRAKVADFGIAKLTASQLTMAGELLGTPSYMSPEQISGHPVDGRSDIFSLGVIVYLMLTGQKPFPGANLTEISFKIAYKNPVLPTQVNSDLSPAADYVIERALAKDVMRRYGSGKEFADDLEDLRQGREPRTRHKFVAERESEQTVVSQAAFIPAVAVNDPTIAATPVELDHSRSQIATSNAGPEKQRWKAIVAVLILLLLLGGAGWWFGRSPNSQSVSSGASTVQLPSQPTGEPISTDVSPASQPQPAVENAGVSQPTGDSVEALPPPSLPDRRATDTFTPPASNRKDSGPPAWAPARGRRNR